MTIERIARLKDYGVFRDFTWPSGLPKFARYNLIYGWNGSGKTLLGNIFRALETKTTLPNGHVTVTVDGRDVSNGDFAQVTSPVRVFNRDFVDESVFPTEGNVAPIFVLGKENVEKQKQVAQLKKTLVDEQAKLTAKRRNKTNVSSSLDKFCIDRALVIKDMLRSSGSNSYNNYNKGNFNQRSKAMVSAGDKDTHLLNDTARGKLLTQLRSNPKSELQPLTYQLPDVKTIKKTVTNLLSTTVVSATIQSLKDDANLSSWVHTGLGIHQEHKCEKCLFCDQLMPKDRLSALESHFSTEYEDLLRKLTDQIITIQTAIRAVTELVIPNDDKFYDDLSSEFQVAAAALRDERDSAKRVLEALVKALENKKNHAFERVALNVTVSELNDGIVDNLNTVILKHNHACDSFQSRIDSARKQLEADSVATTLDEFIKRRGTVLAAKDEVTKANDEAQHLAGEIEKLEMEIVEHRRPAEDLNKDLRNYLGHNEIRLHVKDTGYTITRHGHDTPTKSLSEGEATAIALLHFLNSLGDRRFDLQNGIVVLDDPVSSLDQNALFAAFGFIRARTRSAAQIIIFTHNFTFFRLVREWFRNLRGPDKGEWQVYMLRCNHEASGRCASLCKIDSLLMDYESEYHYLFSRVYQIANESPATSLEKYYGVPSVARRVLEMFLAFRVPGPRPDGRSSLWKQMCEIHSDDGKYSRLYRFLQTHSHRNAIGDADEDLSLLAESRSVLNDLLKFMQSADPDHFSRMIRLVAPSEADGDQS